MVERFERGGGYAARCQVFLPLKRRQCKFPTYAGSAFCVHHVGTVQPSIAPVYSPAAEQCTPSDTRVPCPLDPRHSVFAHKLESHLRSCNRSKDADKLREQPWFSRGLHAACSAPPCAPAHDAGERADLRELIARIKAAHASLGELVQPAARAAERPAAPLPSSQKHAAQCAALAELAVRGARRDGEPRMFVEFGAGNATLSEAVALACAADPSASSGGAPPCTLVIVDKIVPRSKSDRRLRELPDVRMARLRTDICDVDLSRVRELGWGGRAHRCAMAKHLCGDAADLALRCCAHGASAASSGPPGTCAVDSVLIATCCHHRCSWGSYVNRGALLEWGLTEATFPLATAMSHWAVETGGGSARPEGARAGEGEACEREHAGARPKHAAALRALVAEQGLQLDGGERLAIGEMVKELLDAGRARFLCAAGYACARVERGFVPRHVTPENRLLRAEGFARAPERSR